MSWKSLGGINGTLLTGHSSLAVVGGFLLVSEDEDVVEVDVFRENRDEKPNRCLLVGVDDVVVGCGGELSSLLLLLSLVSWWVSRSVVSIGDDMDCCSLFAFLSSDQKDQDQEDLRSRGDDLTLGIGCDTSDLSNGSDEAVESIGVING